MQCFQFDQQNLSLDWTVCFLDVTRVSVDWTVCSLDVMWVSVDWTVRSLDVTRVYELKEDVSNIFRYVRKMAKVTISFAMSVRMEQLGSRWTDFCEIWYLSIFKKSVKFKFQ